MERDAMLEFAKAFSTSFYLTENMIRRVEMMSDSLTPKDFNDYAKASDLQKPKLATAEVLLATTSYAHYSKVAALLAEYRRVDEQLIVSGPQIRMDRKRVLELLNTEVKRLPAFQKLMVESLSNAAGNATQSRFLQNNVTSNLSFNRTATGKPSVCRLNSNVNATIELISHRL